ncbi:MAG: chemotaxis protein CheA [Pseudomonadota bacterium]
MSGGAKSSKGAATDLAADPVAEIKAGFFVECEELLEELTDALDALAAGHGTAESFNSVFRAVHSIKGGAAAFAMADLADFAHGFETRLAVFREAATVPEVSDVPSLQQAADRLAALIGLASQGIEISEEARLEDAALLAQPQESGSTREMRFTLSGESAGRILKALETLGTVHANIDPTSIPSLKEYDPEACCVSWSVNLHTELPPEKLEAALSELDPDGALKFAPVPGSDATSAPVRTSMPQSSATSSTAPTIRVGLERIDRLVNLVGELVINQAMLARSADELGVQSNSDHSLGLEELIRLTRDLQDSVMQIRAQPVKPLFQRMARICREAALTAGKQIEFVTEGQDTEIDKTVIERLADPLTHMIRNAVDHGIEMPSQRQALGKSEIGSIKLRAFHRSGQVILEITDDGAGIDRDKVLARARSKGLIVPQTELTPQEIDHLLFRPGFSTAEEVSALSGRGVGMDVVRASVHALGGRISVESEKGRGTRFEIALPLTLAVLDAMIVSAASETLVFPLSTIHETITVAPEDVLELGPGRRMLRYIGKAIALVDLGQALGYHGYQAELGGSVALIIQSEGKAPVAIVIDEIHEQRQVVIKGLQDGFTSESSVAAATILGDGKIALIIDPFDPTLAPEGLGAAQGASIPLNLSA